MQINIEQYQKQIGTYVERVQDVRFVGQVVFVVIVLLISWSGVKSIQTNYALQQQITGLKQQNSLQELANDNLRLSKDYYESDQYLELSARQNFGLALPGEKQVVVPKNVALSKLTDIPVPQQAAPPVSKERNNFEAWVDFFLYRTNDVTSRTN